MTHQQLRRPWMVGCFRYLVPVLVPLITTACSEAPLRPRFVTSIPEPARIIDVDDDWNQMTFDVEVLASGLTGATENASRGYRYSVTRQLGANGVWHSTIDLGSMYPSNAVLPAGMPSPPTRIETADDRSYLRIYDASGLMPSVTLDTSTHAAPPGLRARPKFATPLFSDVGVNGPGGAAPPATSSAAPNESPRAWADAYVVGPQARGRALGRLMAMQGRPGVGRERRDSVDVFTIRQGRDSVRVTINPTTGLVHERAAFRDGTSTVKRNAYARIGADAYVLKESQTERRAADGTQIGPTVTTRFSNVKLSLLSPPTT